MPARAAVLGSPDLLAHILQPLSNQNRQVCGACSGARLITNLVDSPNCRASCEAVCRAAPQLWARVEMDILEHSTAELHWLCQHGPVRQAQLDLFAPSQLRTMARCLAIVHTLGAHPARAEAVLL